MVQESLKQLGFGDKEIAVYLAILQKGKMTPAGISRITKINRTTVYSVAKELMEKGVITEDMAGRGSTLIALPPNDLNQLAIKEERELIAKRKLISETITELQSLTADKQYPIPKIHFVYEEEIKDYLRKQSPTWNKHILQADKIWWGFQDHTFVEHYQDWIDWYWQNAPQEIFLRLLTNQSNIEEEMRKRNYERRQMKFWDRNESFTGTTWVNGDYIIMIRTNKRPHYLVEIYDADLAYNMRALLKGIWDGMK